MVNFLDGPAAGVSLFLRRAPTFLRAVRGPDGWDALDLLTDVPDPGESLVAYRLAGPVVVMHIDYTDRVTRRRRGAWYKVARYRVCPDKPDDATMRDTASWRAWCVEQAAKEKESK